MKKLYPQQRSEVNRTALLPGVLNRSKIGAGKTGMTLDEIDNIFGGEGSCAILVIAPNTARSVWEDQAPDWTTLPVTMLDRKDRAGSWKTFLATGGIFVVHWEALRVMDELQTIEWDVIVADEAHFAKNRKAVRTKKLKQLRTTYKRALTGTLIVNRPDDAWSILNWLYPKDFRSYWRHFEEFVAYTTDYFGYKHIIGPKNEEKFRALIEPFTIFVDRPQGEVVRQTIHVDLDPRSRRAYEEMRKDSLAWIGHEPDEAPLPAPVVLARMTRLRQFACAYLTPRSLPMGDVGEPFPNGLPRVSMSDPSSKLDALVDFIESTDEKVVVFSQFAQLITLAFSRLAAKNIGAVTHYGPTDDAGRIRAREDFAKEPSIQVFLATMQTGGVGLDGLQRVSSTMVFLDRHWSPAVNAQAEGRLIRDGQRDPVLIADIRARDTVDEAVESKLNWKRSTIRKMLGGE